MEWRLILRYPEGKDKRLRQQTAVAELGHKALTGDDVEALMAEAALAVAESLGVQYCSVLELLPEGDALIARAGFGWSEEILGKQTAGAGSDSQAGYTLASGGPVVIEDLSQEDRFKVHPLFLEKGLVSGLSVIIHGKDKPFGVMGVHTTSRRVFDEHDISFVQSVANVLGAAIERRRAEEARCEAEARYRSIVENAHEGIFQSSIDGRIIFANQAFAEISGYESPQELLESVTDVATQIYANPEQRAEFVELMSRQGGVNGYELNTRRKDGSIILASVNVRSVRGDEGELIGFEGFVEDISERRRIEEAIRDSEEKQRLLLQGIDEIVYMVETGEDPLKGNVAFVSDKVESIMGYQQSDFLEDPSTWFGNIHPDDIQAVTDATKKLYEDRKSLTRFYRMRHKVTGEYKWLEDRVVPRLDESGNVTGSFGVVRDVTERKRAEEELSKSERGYRRLVETSPDGILMLDEKMRIRMCNRRAAELVGLRQPDELMGKNIREFLTPDGLPLATDAAMVIISGKSVENLEFTLTGAGGHEVPVEISGTLMELPETSEKRIICFVRDVSFRKEAENAAIASEARLIEAQRLAHVGNWVWDIGTGELDWSGELYHIFGVDQSDTADLYARFLEAIHPEDRDRFLKTLEEDLEPGETRDMDFRIIRPDGRERLVSSSAEIIFGESVNGVPPPPSPERIMGTIQDITEQRQAEQELLLLKIITQAIGETEDLNSALVVTLKQVCELTGWTLGEAWVPDSEGTHLECSPAWYCSSDDMSEFREASCQNVFPEGVGLPGRVWAAKQPEWIEDVTLNGKFRRSEYARRAGLKAAVAIPVLMKDEVVAVMDFFVREPRAEDRKFIELISSVAAQLGSVIVRKRAEERVKDYNMLLNAISRTLLNFVNGIATDKVFEDLLYRLLFLTQSNLGFIGDVEYRDGKLFMTARASNSILDTPELNNEGHIPGARVEIKKDGSLIGRIFRDEGPVIANELGTEGEKLAVFFGGHVPASNFLGIPFRSGENISGMIGVADREVNYGEETVSFLQPLLVTCANILEADRNDERRLLAERDLVESLQTLQKTFEGVVQALASTAESRDPYTAGHQQRVSRLAVDLAREMGLSKDRIEGLRVAGLVHDLGKMAVPVEILSKPGRINEHEFNIIKTHSQVSYDILKPVGFPWPVATTAHQHHERLDGSGYPLGLKGDEISLEARVLAVADVVEAMASHRPYRAAVGIEAALEEITGKKGDLFDPEAVDACLRLFNEKGYELG